MTKQLFLFLILVFNFFIFIKSLVECKKKNNAFGKTKLLFPLGMFVWGDVVVLGSFWVLASFVSLVFSDWLFFWLVYSVFWLVRAVGEVIYWFNQQFSPLKRNPPEKLLFYSVFKNNSIWFAYQLFWQCVTIFSIITTVLLMKLWLV